MIKRILGIILIITIITAMMPATFAAGSYRGDVNNDYLFAIKDEKESYTLLGGDSENGYFVIANDYYGTYAYGSVGFDFTNEGSIAYWLNNGFLASDNTLSDSITKYIDKEHKWEEGTAGVSLLSSGELDRYADVIGCNATFNKTAENANVYWWLRDNAGDKERPYICMAGDEPAIKAVSGSSLRLVRPVFYLKADFFANVKLDVFRTGKAVKTLIKDMELSNVIYSASESEILWDTQNNYTISMTANILPDEYILTEPYYDITVKADVGIKDGYYVIVSAEGMDKVKKNINFYSSETSNVKVYLPVFDELKEYTVNLYYDGILLDSYSEQVLAMTDVENDGYNDRGFVTHYNDNNYDVEKTLALLDAVGATVVRDHPLWSTVESLSNGGVGKYVWDSSFVNYVKGLDENGIEMLYILCDNNPLYGKSWNDEFDTPEEINGFANYAVATAKQFPTIKHFEILNEENDKHTVEQYMALCKATGKALKEYDPTIKVSVGAFYTGEPKETGVGVHWRDFLKNMVDSGNYQYIDAVSTHLYHIYYTGDSKMFINDSNYTRECVRDFGGWIDVELTETGYSPAEIELPNWGLSEEKQADEMVKRSVINDSLGYSLVTNYVLKDKATTGAEKFHFVDDNNRPLEAYYAMKNFYDVTKYAVFMGEIKASDKVRAFWYRDNGKNTVIMWQKPDAISGNQSPKKESSTIAKVTYNSPDIKVYDILGNEIEFDGTVTLERPKYVVDIPEEELKSAYASKALERLSYHTDYLKDSTIDLYCNEYAALCTAPTTENVTKLLDKLYAYGVSMVENNAAETVVLSARLSDLNDICTEIAKLMVLCEDFGPNNDISVTRSVYESFEKIMGDLDQTAVLYKNKPYTEGRRILNDVLKYKGLSHFESVSGNYSSVDKDGEITISGNCEKLSNVSVKLEMNGNIAFASYQMSDEKGNYSFTTTLPECGEYNLTLNDGELHSEIVPYVKANVSDEDKMIYSKNLQARGLLNWAEVLMDRELKASQYLYLENVDFDISESNIDFSFTYDYDGELDNPVLIAASYVDGRLAGSRIIETVKGENDYVVSVDCGNNSAEIKIMLFDGKDSIEPLKRSYILTY